MGDRPSSIFKRYVAKYPNSHIARDYNSEYGKVVSGHFAEALYRGDMDAIATRADFDNREKLVELGFKPSWWG